MPANDDELLHAAVLGDHDAIEQLLEWHGPAVRKSIEGRIDQRWNASLNEDDVLQQTYLEAFLGIRDFQPNGIGSFVSWLKTLANRNLIDAVRELKTMKQGGDKRRVTEPAADPDGSYVDLLNTLGGTVTSPTKHADRGDLRTLLDAALERLPEPYQMAVKLFDLADCTPEDAAEACGCSVGAMYMRRSRAHVMLREILSNDILE